MGQQPSNLLRKLLPIHPTPHNISETSDHRKWLHCSPPQFNLVAHGYAPKPCHPILIDEPATILRFPMEMEYSNSLQDNTSHRHRLNKLCLAVQLLPHLPGSGKFNKHTSRNLTPWTLLRHEDPFVTNFPLG